MEEYYVEGEKPALKAYSFEFFLVEFQGDGFSASRHLHPAVEIILIKEGHGTVEIGNTSLQANPGDVFLFRAHTLHSIAVSEACSYYVLKMTPRVIMDMLAGPSTDYALFFLNEKMGDRVRVDASETRALSPYFQQMDSFMRSGKDVDILAARAVSGVVLCRLFEMIASDTCPRPEISVKADAIRQIYDSILYIDAHFDEPITAADCAKALSVSYSLFARYFKAVVGKTFTEYLRELRLSHAKSLLLSSNKSVSEVALLCGYNHISYFIKEFKQQTTLSPLQFRKASGKIVAF